MGTYLRGPGRSSSSNPTSNFGKISEEIELEKEVPGIQVVLTETVSLSLLRTEIYKTLG